MSRDAIAALSAFAICAAGVLAPALSKSAVVMLDCAPLSHASIAFSLLLGLGLILTSTVVLVNKLGSDSTTREKEADEAKRIAFIAGLFAVGVGAVGTLACLVAGWILIEKSPHLWQDTLSGLVFKASNNPASELWQIGGADFGFAVGGVVLGIILGIIVASLVPGSEKQQVALERD